MITQALQTPPPVGETTLRMLETLEDSSQTPVILTDEAGNVLAASPNLRHECAAATAPPSATPLRADGERITCVNESCLHFAGCAACALPDTPQLRTGLHVLHCRGEKHAETSAALVAHALAADAEKAGLMDNLSNSYEELHLLESLAGAFEDEIDHRMTFLKMLDSVRRLLPFRAAEIWTLHAGDKQLRCLLHHDGTTIQKSVESLDVDPAVEKPLCSMGARVFREIPPRSDDPIDTLVHEVLGFVGSPAVLVPLMTRSRLLGLLVLQLPEDFGRIDSAKLRMFSAAGRQASLVMQVHLLVDELRSNEGLRREMEIARQIQTGLLPQEVPTDSMFDLFAGCVTAAHVGGDYYDFFELSPDEIGLLVADVSGHSVASGLVAMSFRSSFRHFLHEQKLPHDELFTRVNRCLEKELSQTGHFLSAVYGTFHKRERRFRYVNAGHPPPLIYNVPTDTFRTENEVGLLIGVLPEWEYHAGETILDKGDLLLLYTDGILEAENQLGEMFGIDRLEAAIRKHHKKGVKEMYHYLLRELYVFQDEQFNQDDVTLLLLKILA
jgi:serine phosphatase RsbU (regulator of sigma subunit)